MAEQGPPPGFIPPEPYVPDPEATAPARPLDFLLLIPLALILIGLGIGWYVKWESLPKPLPRDWSPACNEEVMSWQSFRPPPELQWHSEPGEWVLGHSEVAVRWHGMSSMTPQGPIGTQMNQDALTTSTGEPTILTRLIGSQLSVTRQYSNQPGTPIDAGLTPSTVWFLGATGQSGSILELVTRDHAQQVTPIRLPDALTSDNGTPQPVTWIARNYGADRLLLIGSDSVHASPEFAELQVLRLPGGQVESTVRVSLKLQRFDGNVDEDTGTIQLVSLYRPREAWRMQVETGALEAFGELPAEYVEANTPQNWIGGWLQPELTGAKATGRARPTTDIAYWDKPGVVLEYRIRSSGGAARRPNYSLFDAAVASFDPSVGAHPQEMYLQPAIGMSAYKLTQQDALLDAVLQSESCPSDPVPLDASTLKALRATYATDCVLPLKLHPISTKDVLVSQLVRPGTRKAGNLSGMVRLGWLDQQTLAITWLGWWSLPAPEFDGKRQVDSTFAITSDTGWLLVAGNRDPPGNLTLESTCYAAQRIDNFDTWLDARLPGRNAP